MEVWMRVHKEGNRNYPTGSCTPNMIARDGRHKDEWEKNEVLYSEYETQRYLKTISTPDGILRCE